MAREILDKDLNTDGNQITGLPGAVDPTDAVSKQDLDDAIAGVGGGGGGSPLTTKGDLFTYDTGDARLPVGADGEVLTADSGEAAGVKWATPSGGGGGSPLTTKGDLFTYDTGDARLPVGADGEVLTADSGEAAGVKWATPSGGGGGSPLTTKGDLFTYDTGDARLPVGADGEVLTADSGEAAGVKWAVPGAGGTQPALWYDLAVRAQYDGTSLNQGGGLTMGMRFMALHAMTMTGIKCWWMAGGVSRTVKLSVWNALTGTRLASVNVVTGTADSMLNGVFSSSVSLVLGGSYFVTCWETTNAVFVNQMTGVAPAGRSWPYLAGPYVDVQQWGAHSGGDTVPNTQGAYMATCWPVIDPV